MQSLESVPRSHPVSVPNLALTETDWMYHTRCLVSDEHCCTVNDGMHFIAHTRELRLDREISQSRLGGENTTGRGRRGEDEEGQGGVSRMSKGSTSSVGMEKAGATNVVEGGDERGDADRVGARWEVWRVVE